MLRRHYNLILAGAWLTIAAVLLFPEVVLPDDVRRQVRLAGPLAGVLALVFAVYNVVRWWAFQRLYRDRTERRRHPLAPRPQDHEEKYAPNPDLDFLKVPDADNPPRGSDGEPKS